MSLLNGKRWQCWLYLYHHFSSRCQYLHKPLALTLTSMGLGALSLTTAGPGAAASAASALPDLRRQRLL
jgi:hypothetical protein